MKIAAVLVVLLCGASTAANAAVIGTLDVTSGFFGSSNFGGTFDGAFSLVGDDFTTNGAPANNNFHLFTPTLDQSFGANGDFPYPLTADGTTYQHTSFSMVFTHDPITIWQPPVFDSPQTSAFTMTGELRTCAFFPGFPPCPADIPTFTLIGQGTMTAEWHTQQIGGPFFSVSYTFTVPEPSTLMLLLLAIVGVAITPHHRFGKLLSSRRARG